MNPNIKISSQRTYKYRNFETFKNPTNNKWEFWQLEPRVYIGSWSNRKEGKAYIKNLT